ncbi:MAG: agglutinin biogenesis protein MshP, partial [Burkholderiaceae bacterium]|nr:agglutinin biogenesis protein MshP [Burkholderiaceae bacterium]
MSPNRPRAMPRNRAGGASLVTAIFLLVVLAGMAAAMVNLSTSQHAASAMDVRGARAYQAARAGAEWALYQQLQLATCNATAT